MFAVRSIGKKGTIKVLNLSLKKHFNLSQNLKEKFNALKDSLIEVQKNDRKKKKKVTIVGGAGRTGRLLAYKIFLKNYIDELIILDKDKDQLKAECLDLKHGAAWSDTPIVEGSTDFKASADSDLIIINSGIPKQSATQSRLELLSANIKHFKEIIPDLAQCSPDAVLLIVSNPVDVLSYAAWKISGFDKYKVIGAGTEIDTARFRYYLSNKLKINPNQVDAWIIGEHGDSSVACWSSINVAGTRLRDLDPKIATESDPNDWQNLHKSAKKAAEILFLTKGFTATGVGMCTENICRSIITDRRVVHACSTYVTGIHGLTSRCFMSLPCVIGHGGVRTIIRQTLTEDELRKLSESGKVLDNVLKNISI